MENSWDKFKRLRMLYIFAFFLYPVFVVIVWNLIPDWKVTLAYTLIHGAALYFFILRRIFALKCPVCGQNIFPQPGGSIFFVKCTSCGAKMGQTHSTNSP